MVRFLLKITLIAFVLLVILILVRPGIAARIRNAVLHQPTTATSPTSVATNTAPTTTPDVPLAPTPVTPASSATSPTTPKPTTTGLAAGAFSRELTVDGKQRTYIEYVPTKASTSGGQVNVLLVLHGTGGTGQLMRGVGFDAYADQGGFITVYPDSLTVGGVLKWDAVHDLPFMQSLVSTVEKQLGSRMGKLYVTGMSNGSYMTQVLGCAIPDVAGIAPLSASINDYIMKQCKPTHALPYIGFYGTEDRFGEIDKYETSVAFFSSVNGCTANYSSTQLPDVDPTDGTTVELRTYLNTSGSACSTPVLYYRITGGGHFWPGATGYTNEQIDRNTGHLSLDVNATKLIVAFFGLN